MIDREAVLRTELKAALAYIANLEAALKPFSDAAAILPADAPVMRVRLTDDLDFSITGADLHRAREALTK